MITTYHALLYEQVLRMHPQKRESVKAPITNLVKQGRLHLDAEKGLLCDCESSAESPDLGIIAAFWVLLDFQKAMIYHTVSDFPVKISFFCHDEEYQIFYAEPEKESLLNRLLAKETKDMPSRIIIVQQEEQARTLSVPGVIAFCTVSPEGKVSYYRKARK